MTPPYVTLHVWGVSPRRVPAALTRMALDRRALRPSTVPGTAVTTRPTFAKLLGTGSGRTFTPGDADPRHWALLSVWDDEAQAVRFERDSSPHRAWRGIADEQLRVALRPQSSRGQWSGREPFGSPQAERSDGPVAALTRARIRTSRTLTFWRAVPPVSTDLHHSPGLRLALGIGEAPVGLQGTFSLWASSSDLVSFAHRGAAHTEAIRRTSQEGWYAEELFARFGVLSIEGTYAGRTP